MTTTSVVIVRTLVSNAAICAPIDRLRATRSVSARLSSFSSSAARVSSLGDLAKVVAGGPDRFALERLRQRIEQRRKVVEVGHRFAEIRSDVETGALDLREGRCRSIRPRVSVPRRGDRNLPSS